MRSVALKKKRYEPARLLFVVSMCTTPVADEYVMNS